MLSLGPQHSFPLSDVFRYLHPETTRDVLIQAFLDAPVFKTRWRWNTTVALAVPRSRGGRKVAPQLQRMLADDLMAAVFPDAAACLENIPGDRQIPDHPLVSQTVRDCLQEAMDFEGLRTVLDRIHRGDLRLVSRDTPEPSVFAHDILNAKPYAFLDDAPLEERRAHAVQSRRAGDVSSAGDLGALDEEAIDRVREEERPDPRDAHELHDTLMSVGLLFDGDLPAAGREYLDQLQAARRAGRVAVSPSVSGWIAAERIPEILAIHPAATVSDGVQAPPSRSRRVWQREDAARELVRGRLTIAGPVSSLVLARSARAHRRRHRGRAARARGRRRGAAGALFAGGERAGMVRPGAAGAHPPLHAHAAARRDRAGHRRRLHALPVPMAARRPVDPAGRTGRAARGARRARRLRARRRRVGERRAAVRGWKATTRRCWTCCASPAKWPGAACRRRLRRPTSGPPQLTGATPIAIFLREHRDAWRGGDAEDARASAQSLRPNARAVLAALAAARTVVPQRPGGARAASIATRSATPSARWWPRAWPPLMVSPGCARCCRRTLRAHRAGRGQFAGRWTAPTVPTPRPGRGDRATRARSRSRPGRSSAAMA